MGELRQILAVFGQRLERRLRRRRRHTLVAADVLQNGQQAVFRHVVAFKQTFHGMAFDRHADEQMVHADVVVLQLFGEFLRLLQDLRAFLSEIDLPRVAGHLVDAVQLFVDFIVQRFQIDVHTGHHGADRAFRLLQQRRKQMQASQFLMVHLRRHLLGFAQRLAAFFREFVIVHILILLSSVDCHEQIIMVKHFSCQSIEDRLPYPFDAPCCAILAQTMLFCHTFFACRREMSPCRLSKFRLCIILWFLVIPFQG